MLHENTSLAALIGSRICHDLINPIGAISNGLELVAMGASNSTSPEMTLIQQSCDNASARIQFFRIAFGSAGDTRPIPNSEARKTLAQHYAGTRITTDWTIQNDVGRHRVQLGYLAALCLETALPQGGEISISVGETTLIACALGSPINFDKQLWSILKSDAWESPNDLLPAHVQFALLSQLIDGSSLTLNHDEHSVELQLSLSNPAV